MADKIDHLLTDYFTGQLEANIKLRKLELSYHNDHDDNIGGGRMQNIGGIAWQIR
ncbi:RinA family protein [Weissella paramesenteroides]|uniref:RinA family protein n=1 Tax=Weissella paramesenteroides TaxID=1249 RepID=UPI002073658B|nr:RinA family protein [Weissella paramesenteroides]MCM6769038.1 RinA family protein [Weissella paramesenteroides]